MNEVKHDDRARKRRPWGRLVLGVAIIYVVAMVGLALYWCRQPPVLDVVERAQQQATEVGGQVVPGTTFVAATIGVADTLLSKPGGFLHNDRFPPGVFLDNCPSWECGVIMALRDALRALRDDFSRNQTQSAENIDLRRADLQFSMDPKFWIMPSAEAEYRKGIDALWRYQEALSRGQGDRARFSVRADNLAEYLALVEKRLGNFGLRLSAGSGASRLTQGLFPDADQTAPEPSAPPQEESMASRPSPSQPSTPSAVDEVFYCARGYSWALLQFVQALQVDFAPVIADKNAEPALAQIERDLKGAVKAMHSPIVLNGNGFGLLSNHSLVLASYIARINAAVIDLRLLLQQG
jgi:hypothetical protein